MISHVYILKNDKHPNWFYIGSTENFWHRLREHWKGKCFSTQQFKDGLYCYRKIQFNTREDAYRAERCLRGKSLDIDELLLMELSSKTPYTEFELKVRAKSR
jgi:predicted GIY-YIG superfamily endonuclease